MKTKRAFTLIELIITIALMVILSGMIMPLLAPQLNKYRLQVEIQKLFFDLKQTQQLSLSREDGYSYYGLKFYAGLGQKNEQQGYKIIRYEPKEINPAIPLVPAVEPTIVKSDQLSDKPIIYENNLAFDRRVAIADNSRLKLGDRIIFSPEGSATSDGQLLLSSSQDGITLRCGNFSRSIAILPLTGNVQIN